MAADPTSSRPTVRRRALVYGLAALIVAGGTAFLVFQYVAQLEGRMQVIAAEQGRQAVVATVDLMPGTVIQPGDVDLGARPPAAPEEQVFLDPEVLHGQTVSELVLAGEAIRPQRLAATGGTLGIHEVLDPVARAVTIMLPAEGAVGGLLMPGHYVDVMATVQRATGEGRQEFVTEAVLQGVRVLAVDTQVARGRVGIDSPEAVDGEERRAVPGARFVTLEAEPREAKGLIHASTRGRLHLVLRPGEELELADYGEPVITSSLVSLPEGLEGTQRERLARKREISDLTARAEQRMTEIVQIRGSSRTVDTIREESP